MTNTIPQQEELDLQGQLLIATPEMDDEYFKNAVIYLCEHHEEGAIGLMINSPTDLTVMELLAKMEFLMANERNYKKDQLVLCGGPVSPERGFILHTPSELLFLNSYPTDVGMTMTTSGDFLEALGTSDEPENFLICLGCCTWKANQLEEELARNCWITAPANHDILFKTGYLDRWNEANALLGIDGVLGNAGRA